MELKGNWFLSKSISKCAQDAIEPICFYHCNFSLNDLNSAAFFKVKTLYNFKMTEYKANFSISENHLASFQAKKLKFRNNKRLPQHVNKLTNFE